MLKDRRQVYYKLLFTLSLLLPGLHVFPTSLLVLTPIIAERSCMFLLDPMSVRLKMNLLISSLILMALFCVLSLYHYDISRVLDVASYVVRVICFILVVKVSNAYLNTPGSSLKQSTLRFSRLIRDITYVLCVFELIFPGTILMPIMDLYEARMDLGGIHTLHYNRLSGPYSFPGDLALVLVFIIAMFTGNLAGKTESRLTIVIALYFLWETQSRAGFITLIVFYFILILFRYKLLMFLSVILFIPVAIVLKIDIPAFDQNLYLFRNIDTLSYFLEKSARFQEHLLYYNNSFAEYVLGVHTQRVPDFFEVENISAFSRLGIIGWLLLGLLLWPLLCIAYHAKLRRHRLDNWVLIIVIFWLVLLFVYNNISAGLSRPKLMIISGFLFATLLQVARRFKTRCTLR